MRPPLGERAASWNRALALAGGILIAAGLTVLLIQGKASLWGSLALGLGLLLLLLAWVANPGAVHQVLASRAGRYRGTLALMSVAVVGMVVLLNILSYSHYGRWDLSADGRFALSPETRRVLDQVEQPLQITGFFYSDEAAAERTASERLESYVAYNPLLSYRIVDPDLHPSLAERYDISSSTYTLVVESGDRWTSIYAVDEESLTGAILRVTSDRTTTVYFVSGHGEPAIDREEGDGYSAIAGVLQNTYQVDRVELATYVGTLPVTDTVVVLAGPRQPLLAGEVQLLVDYLHRGGRLLVLLDPASPDLAEVLGEWGIRADPGLVVDPASALAGDATAPVAAQFNLRHEIVRDLQLIFFPGARPVNMAEAVSPALTVIPLLGTTESAWAEEDDTEQPPVYDPEEDVAGTLFLAITSQGRLSESGAGREARLVLVGDSDCIQNRYAAGTNELFFLNAVSWLAEEEGRFESTPAQTTPRLLVLTAAQTRAIRVVTLAGMPLLVLVVGVAVWGQRRKK